MSPAEGAPEEFDQTIFAVNDRTIGTVERLTLNLVKEQQRYNVIFITTQYTSPSSVHVKVQILLQF